VNVAHGINGALQYMITVGLLPQKFKHLLWRSYNPVSKFWDHLHFETGKHFKSGT